MQPRDQEPVEAERKFRADFGSTDDEARDAELTLLEDGLHTIEEIQAICKRYGVWARAIDSASGLLVDEFGRSGTRSSPPSR
jgi:hypothetical protein